MFFSEETVDDAMRSLISEVLANGESVSASKGDNLEIAGVQVKLSNPRARLSRTEAKGRLFSCLGELLWYISGSNHVSFIEYYAPKYRESAEEDGSVFGGYGPRLFPTDSSGQFANVQSLLRKRPDTRQAVIQIFSGSDIAIRKKDTPCTCTLQFLLRNKRLHLIVNMRSNDVWIGFPHDVFCFSMLQEIMATSLGTDVGTYTHFVGSLHLYNNSRNVAEQYLGEGFQSTLEPMPQMPFEPHGPILKSLLEIEGQLRTDPSATLDIKQFDQLPEYWQDVARILYAYRCFKNSDLAALQRVSEQLVSKVYSLFIDRKIEQLKEGNVLSASSGAAEEWRRGDA